MICQKCGTNNVDGVSFCGTCGAPLLQPVQEVQPIQQQPIVQTVYVKPKTNKLSLVGFILSLCGLISFCLTCIPGLICSIIGLIQCSKKKENGKGYAITGIIISSVLIFLCVGFWNTLANITNRTYPGYNDYDHDYDYTEYTTAEWTTRATTEETTKETTEETTRTTTRETEATKPVGLFTTKDIANTNWIDVSNKSYLVFNTDGTFRNYQFYTDTTNNYYSGTYAIFTGEEAKIKIIEGLSSYGWTEEYFNQYFSKNRSVTVDNVLLIVLKHDGMWKDGKNVKDETWITPYVGMILSEPYTQFTVINVASNTTFTYVPENIYKEKYGTKKITKPSESEKVKTADTITIGDPKVGYVDLPADTWNDWKEADGNDSLYESRIQKINKKTGTIICLSTYKDSYSSISIEGIAKNLQDHMNSSGNYKQVDVYRSKLGNIDTYMISGIANDNTNLNIWIFIDSNDKFHYITAEYQSIDNTTAEYMKNTYRLS